LDQQTAAQNLNSPKTSLDDLETPSEPRFATHNPTLHIHLYILVLDLAMSFGGVVIPEHLHWADNVDPLLFGVDEHKRVAFVWGRVGRVGNGENDVDGVTRVAGAGDPLGVSVVHE